jgi:hypothetical protein
MSANFGILTKNSCVSHIRNTKVKEMPVFAMQMIPPSGTPVTTITVSGARHKTRRKKRGQP